MTLNQIVTYINAKLAGEILTYDQLKVHLDSVIDDINAELNAVFPAFSEFNSTTYTQYPDYDFFPDKYIRSVVTLGAAFKFYICDEEGAQSAVVYAQEYKQALFRMQRDYSDQVPEAYQADNQGYLTAPVCEDCGETICVCGEYDFGIFPDDPLYS